MTLLYLQGVILSILFASHRFQNIRYIIEIPFINKVMDFIGLPSIFRDKSVQSTIPNYFQNLKHQSFVINITNLLEALALFQ